MLATTLAPFAFLGLWGTIVAGVAAVSVPVVIHLLNRRRFKVVVWAAMRFLLQAQKQNTRRMRLEQIILLAVRATLVLLVVLAMASITPWAEALWANLWPDMAGKVRQRGARIHKIVVLDASLSMAVKTDGGKTAFDRGREIVLQIVKDSQTGDAVSVALMKDVPVWVVAEPSLELNKVAREVETLRQAHGNANVPATLNMVAAKVVESGKRFDGREVYFITDLQKSTWLSGGAQAGDKKDPKDAAKEARERAVVQEIQKHARTIFIDVGRDKVTNVAVTNLSIGDSLLTTAGEVPILATVHNYGPEPKEQLTVQLRVARAADKAGDPSIADSDHRVVLRTAQQEITRALPGDPTNVAFKYRFPEPGTYVVQVRVEEDDLPVDDARTVIVTVRETVPVLLVNGKPAIDRFERATEYLRLALNPFTQPPIPAFAPLRPAVKTLAEFSNLNDDQLAEYDALYLCDVGKLSSTDISKLKTYLRTGGGLVFSLGDRVADQLGHYNNELYRKGEGLLPAQLLALQSAPADHHFSLKGEDFEQPPLQAFAQDDNRIPLITSRFQRYIRTKPATDARVRKILSFIPEVQSPEKTKLDPEVPRDDAAMLEWNPPLPASERDRAKGAREAAAPGVPTPTGPTRYRGKVVLVTTTLNLDWTTWPGSPSYGAMMQELVRFAVSGRLRERATTVGGVLEEFIPPGPGMFDGQVFLAKLNGKLYIPRREREPATIRISGGPDQTVFRWADTDVSGVYRLLIEGRPQEYLFAVNVPTSPEQRSESNLARVTKEALEGAYPAWEFQLVQNLGDVRHANFTPSDDTETARGNIGPEIAHWLLLGVLALLLVEVVLAWVFGHHTAVPGAGQPPRTGLLAPGLIGGAALVLLLFIGGSLIHAAETGDFLGYLPNGFRAWVEGWLGIPPPAPGENTLWHLEFNPFLGGGSNEFWLTAGIAVLALVLVGAVYRFEANTASYPYKGLLVGLRLFLILFTLAVLLPQLQLRFERQGWPDVAIIIDTTKSMGVPDYFRDEKVQEQADKLSELLKKQIQEKFPARIAALQSRLGDKKAQADKGEKARAEVERLDARLRSLQGQLNEVTQPSWRPTRLQLAQILLGREDPDWIAKLLNERRMKVHLFHLDGQGRLIKLTDAEGNGAGEITDSTDPALQARARQAIAELQPTGNDSRLGTAVRQVLDYYRGASLTAVVMLGDGVTTREETLGQVADYAAQRGVPLFFVGIGDDHDVRDLKLHDLQVEDNVYVHDYLNFEARLTGRGYKDLTLDVVLKVREKDGKEKELAREKVRLDQRGNPVQVRFRHQANEPGEKLFIVEVEMPKLGRDERPPNPADLRLQRTVFVQESKLIKVLYIEGTSRYEYRFIKSLLEREAPDKKRNRAIELKVLLIDADDDFAKQDRTAIRDFPATKQELFENFDVVILGDVDPRSRKLGEQRLRHLADFVREGGRGLLFIAGSQYNPHSYVGTPLADILPVEPAGNPPPEPEERPDGFRPDLTAAGRRHMIFRFSSNEAENMGIWQRLAPLYWWSDGYRSKPLAEVLAVHPKKKAEARPGKAAEGHPLAVEHFVGAGRCMFFGFDETWRWRFREDELRFNYFWVQTVRYLSRSRVTRTTVKLDRQTPYRVGEPIKVTVQFPDASLVPGLKPGDKGPKTDVKVMVEHKPPPGPDGGETEIQTIQLAKVEGSYATYEGLLVRTREGKYKFTLSNPDVSKKQPSGERPSAEAVVVPPPGELDRLRLNVEEMKEAAEKTDGRFYTLADVDPNLLRDLPSGVRVVMNTPRPPQALWNHLLAFLLVIGLLSGEWVLRKRKHLL
ncbi:MAG: VWA domain-containing protein [Gemmataceae bacterium]|nr:VWA domain-containing protein [Gemmataceae bacterium]